MGHHMSIMKIAAVLTLLLALQLPLMPARAASPDPVPAQTNRFICCRHPIRVFTNATVNLDPLFIWWKLYGTNPPSSDTPRPLPAWHRITGSHITEGDGYWMVEAAIYTNASSSVKKRIRINHPPVIEAETFIKLKSEINIDNRQISLDERDYKAAQPTQPPRSGKNHAVTSERQAAQNRHLAIELLADQKAVQEDLALTQKKLAALPSQKGRYFVDFFALEAGEDAKGVPIYDFGALPPVKQ